MINISILTEAQSKLQNKLGARSSENNVESGNFIVTLMLKMQKKENKFQVK